MTSKLILPGDDFVPSLFPDEDNKQNLIEPASFQSTVAKSKSQVKTELIRQIHEINALEADSLAFMPRAAIYAAMPYRRQLDSNGKPLLTYERKNNILTLKLQSIDDTLGIPSGAYPRILLAYMSTCAMRTKSPYIELPPSLYNFLTDLGLNVHGSVMQNMRTQLEAIRKSLYSIEWKKEIIAGDEILSIKKDHMSLIIEESLVWERVARGGRHLKVPEAGGYYVKLSNSFFTDICNNPVPIDIRAMIALLESPLAMDLYAWFTYQASFLRKPKNITWEAMMLQFGSYTRKRDFKKSCVSAIKEVLRVYPTLRVSLTDNGIQICPSPTHVPRIAPMRKDIDLLDVKVVEAKKTDKTKANVIQTEAGADVTDSIVNDETKVERPKLSRRRKTKITAEAKATTKPTTQPKSLRRTRVQKTNKSKE